MLTSLKVVNFTVFENSTFNFGKNLNIIVGENGSGKSHILKAGYVPLAVSAHRRQEFPNESPTKGILETAFADKLRNVFRPDELGRLVRRYVRGNRSAELVWEFEDNRLDVAIGLSRKSKTKVEVARKPSAWLDKSPIYLPTRELLSIYPGFVSMYKTTYTSFEETWYDTCVQLGAQLARGPREATIKAILAPLEEAMGDVVTLDKSGRFYIGTGIGKMEIHLVAEGLRKLATLARLIATGSLLDKGYLFWDEPEANLNPRIVKDVAKAIMEISNNGVQVFLATHSLFLLRELHILGQSNYKDLDVRCFGLHRDDEGRTVTVEQGRSMDDIGDIAALSEDLSQSDRYINVEMGLHPDAKADGDDD